MIEDAAWESNEILTRRIRATTTHRFEIARFLYSLAARGQTLFSRVNRVEPNPRSNRISEIRKTGSDPSRRNCFFRRGKFTA